MSVCKVRLVSVKEQQKKSVELLSFVFGRVGQIRLLVTVRGLTKAGRFSTALSTKHHSSNMRKIVLRSTAPPLSFKPMLAAAVLSVRRCVLSSLHTLCPKRFTLEAVSVRVSTVCCVFFIFLKGGKFFENNFLLGGTITLSCKLWFVGWLVAACKSV